MEERYIATMVLHAVGDSIGFKNGEWEFNYGLETFTVKFVTELLFDFIDIGGINHIDLKTWRISDDTIMHIKTAQTLLENFNSINTFGNLLKERYIEAYEQLLAENALRIPGITLMANLKRLKLGGNWDDTPYDINFGGSGASMRSSCIGLALFGESNRDKLIQVSIEASRITHNSAVGYLGGLTSALFTAFAIEGVEITEWPYRLMELVEGDKVSNYIKKSGRGFLEYVKDSHVFINKWKIYIETKFDDKRKVIKRPVTTNLIFRSQFYYDNFAYKLKGSAFIGSGGDDSVIIAYDCLVDGMDSWEKFVIYDMLHVGDTDTTGCIGASWWGAIKGFTDVPEINYKNLEEKELLIKLGKDLYQKYYKSSN